MRLLSKKFELKINSVSFLTLIKYCIVSSSKGLGITQAGAKIKPFPWVLKLYDKSDDVVHYNLNHLHRVDLFHPL